MKRLLGNRSNPNQNEHHQKNVNDMPCTQDPRMSRGMATIESLMEARVPQGCIAEYVWVDKIGKTRSKARYLSTEIRTVDDLPSWSYDGSSTDQAFGSNSEVILKPQAVYLDPFRGGPNLLVMCDTYNASGEPIESNTRYECNKVMKRAEVVEPWFGLEQEYFLINPETKKPVGFEKEPDKQGNYYCGVSGSRMNGRDIAEAHFKACLHAGIKISGINAEVAPGQWEFQVGPAAGIEGGDMLWMARYLLERIAEKKGLDVSYEPKIGSIQRTWNGSGCHANFSTRAMRRDSGIKNVMMSAIEKLSQKHDTHMKNYGVGNEQRLTGQNELAPMDKFTWGVGDRGCSIRVSNEVARQGFGYFEDRRPGANCDPYTVTRLLVLTCCLD